VGAEAIAHILTESGETIEKVRNPMPASGATPPEALEDVRQYAPQAFRRQERAVTAEDYARMAERHSEVSRAMARRLWTGSWYTVFITVDRLGGRPVDQAFEEELRRFLARFRLAHHDVEIESPRFVSLDIAFTVCVKAGYLQSDVKQALLEIFSNRDFPDGGRGFFHPDGFTFGQRVYLSQIVATAMSVSGVRWVEVDAKGDPPSRFHRWGEKPRREIADGFIDMGHLEIARLDNDPNAPENGKLEFFIRGGL
jgi:predicted phage baseplate assembly protein